MGVITIFKDKNEFWGNICALIPNIIFGFSFLFSKIALQFAHPLMILAVRFTLAFAVLNLLWLFGTIKLNFKGKNLKKLLLMALMQPLLYFIFELYGINAVSSALSGVIISLVPVAVIILSGMFLSEKPTARQVICSVISLVSVAAVSILSNDGKQNTITGIVLLLVAVICAAFFNILSRDISGDFTPAERTYMMFLVGSVGFNLIALMGLRENFIVEFIRAAIIPDFWYAICYLSVISSIIAFLMYNHATTKISAVRAASYSNVITVVSLLAGLFILNEYMTIWEILCCIVIILGVYGVNKE